MTNSERVQGPTAARPSRAVPDQNTASVAQEAAVQAVLPLVEDYEVQGPGQARKGIFVQALRADLVRMVDEELRDTPFQGRNCPWIDHYLDRLAVQPVADSARILGRWLQAPLPHEEGELRRAIVDRARRGVVAWRTTARLPDLPPGGDGIWGGIAPDLAAAAGDLGAAWTSLRATAGAATPGLLRKPDGSAGKPLSPARVRARLGSGQPLDGSSRVRFERGLGGPLGDVRVHDDAAAASVARDAGARAFTVGRDIGFAAGEWRPGSVTGQALLAHELAHTLQGGGRLDPAGAARQEREADAAAARALSGAQGAVQAEGGGLRLQRCSEDPKMPLPEYEGSAPIAANAPSGTSAERPLVADFHGGNHFTLDVDVNGDQLTELRLRIAGRGSEQDPSSLDGLDLTLEALSGDGEANASFDVVGLSFLPRLFPNVTRLGNGLDPLRVALDTSGGIVLELSGPRTEERDLIYEVTLQHDQAGVGPPASQSHSFRLPRESVHLQDLIRPTGPVGSVADARYFDAEVGAFGDRFRFTFVPLTRLSVRMGITPVSTSAEALGGISFEAWHPHETDELQVSVIDAGGDPGLHVDLDGDGRADIIVYTDVVGLQGGPDLSEHRRHRFYAHWPGTATGRPGDGMNTRSGQFDIRGGRVQVPPRRPYDMEAVSAATAADSAQLRTGAASRAEFVASLSMSRSTLRHQAMQEGRIPADLASAMGTLEHAMADLLEAKAPPADDPDAVIDDTRVASLRSQAAEAARAFGAVLEVHAASLTERTSYSSGNAIGDAFSPTDVSNPATGSKRTVQVIGSDTVIQAAWYDQLASNLVWGWDDLALAAYNDLVRGFDRYVASRLDEADRTRMQSLLDLDLGVSRLPAEARPIRAVFHFEGNNNDDGRVFDAPVYLFYWLDGHTWHIRNITNPNEGSTREVDQTVDSPGEHPPRSLFEELNDGDIFPRGMLWYSIPDGPSGHVRCTDPWEFHDILNWIGIGLVVIGAGLLIIGSGGTALPVIGGYAVAVGSAVSGIAGIASMVDRVEDGNWDATGWVLDSLQVVGSFAGAASAFRAVSVGAGMTAPGAPAYARTVLGMSTRGGAFILTMNAVSTGSDVISFAIVSGQNVRQLMAIDASSASDDDKVRMRVQLLASWALNGGLVALSIYGDVATARQASHLDMEGATPVLRDGEGDVDVPAGAGSRQDTPDGTRGAPPARGGDDAEGAGPGRPIDESGPEAGGLGPHAGDGGGRGQGPTSVDAPGHTSAVDSVTPSADPTVQRALARADAGTSRVASFSTQADLDAAVAQRAAVASSPEGSTPWGRAYVDYLDERIGLLRRHLADPSAPAPRPPLGSLRDYWMHRALSHEGQRFSEYLDALRARLGSGPVDAELDAALARLFASGAPPSTAAIKQAAREGLDDLLFTHLGLRASSDPRELARMNDDLQAAMQAMGPNDRGRLGESWRRLRSGGEGLEAHEQVRVDAADMASQQGVNLAGNRRLDDLEVRPSDRTLDGAQLEDLGVRNDELLDAVGDSPVAIAEHVEVKSGGVSDLDQLRDHVRLTQGNSGAGSLVEAAPGRWVLIQSTALELQRPGILRQRPELASFLQSEYLVHARTRLICFDGGRMLEIRGPLPPGTDLLAHIDALLGH